MGEANHIDGIGVELRNAIFSGHAPDDFRPFDWRYGTERAPLSSHAGSEPIVPVAVAPYGPGGDQAGRPRRTAAGRQR
jgi:hypothetical protein